MVFLGPVSPYRGGIAHHGTMLAKALESQAECLTISFSRQYPKWLFPGKSDKEEGVQNVEDLNVEYLIDSINPISWWTALKRIKSFNPSILVIPWWHVYWFFCFGFLLKSLGGNRPRKTIIVHNVVEHESARWKQFLSKKLLAMGDQYLVHTEQDGEHLRRLFPGKSVAICPLPLFDQFPRVTSSLPRRGRLELLFFGFVRPYKGLPTLLEAMAQLSGKDVYLTVLGEFWNGYEEASDFIQANALAGQVEVIDRYLLDAEAAHYFERCDVVVMPYLSATGSGIVPLAYHYEKPVLATSVGGIPDVVQPGRTGQLVEPGSSSALSAAILGLLEGEQILDHEAMQGMRASLSWQNYAGRLLNG